MNLTYRLPGKQDKKILEEYVQEHFANGEMELSASMNLENTPVDRWIEKIQKNATEASDDWGRSYTLLCFDGEKFIGLLAVRFELTNELSWIVGDVGYAVRPSERRKGYATQMLAQGLEISRRKGLKEVVLGCFKDNIGSAKTIQAGGGVLKKETDAYEKGRTSQYYVIEL